MLVPTASDWREAYKKKPDETVLKQLDLQVLKIHVNNEGTLSMGLPVEQVKILGIDSPKDLDQPDTNEDSSSLGELNEDEIIATPPPGQLAGELLNEGENTEATTSKRFKRKLNDPPGPSDNKKKRKRSKKPKIKEANKPCR